MNTYCVFHISSTTDHRLKTELQYNDYFHFEVQITYGIFLKKLAK